MVLRPYLTVGAAITPDNRRTVQAGFLGASVQAGSFATTIDAPTVLGVLDIGLQVYRRGGFEVKAEYGLRASDTYLTQNGSLRAAYHF
jgi:hypothetical protein